LATGTVSNGDSWGDEPPNRIHTLVAEDDGNGVEREIRRATNIRTASTLLSPKAMQNKA
jgi:hypothetical protein